MEIIYIHQYFTTPQMSGGTRSYEFARRMVRAGHVVHMITTDRSENITTTKWLQTDEQGIKAYWLNIPYSNKMGFFRRLKAFFLFAFFAFWKAKSLSGDVIFATSTPLTVVLPAALTAKRKKIPMVFEVRDLWPEMPIAMGFLKNPLMIFLSRKLELWAYKNSDAIVALSGMMKDGIVKTGYPENRIAVIPNGSDNVEFSVANANPQKFLLENEWIKDTPFLVYTGTFGKVNGIEYLVELAQELDRIASNVKILLVGGGSEENKILELAKEYNVYQKNLHIMNLVPKSYLPNIVAASSIASNIVIDLPEARANSANKFFDCLAAGKPIFINHGGWMADVIMYHSCGISAWEKSIDEVAIDLNEKLNDSMWLQEKGNNARFVAENFFDRDILANQLMDVLEIVVNGEPEKTSEIANGKFT